MGSGISTALILSNIFVVLKEINPKYLQKGIKAIEANLQALLARGKITEDKVMHALSIITGVLDYSEFKHVDLVIEAVIESVPLKQSIFHELEKMEMSISGEPTRDLDSCIEFP